MKWLQGVTITTGVTGIKRVVECSADFVTSTPGSSSPREILSVGPSPTLANQMSLFSRELVDLLKVTVVLDV